MKTIGVIGGSGFYVFPELSNAQALNVRTPYGELHNTIVRGEYQQVGICFVQRHGADHKIPPHKINYRANIHALAELGVEAIIAVNAVGGIHPAMAPGSIVIPDQIIDYTYGREHSFFDGFATVLGDGEGHIDFSEPFNARLRAALLAQLSPAAAISTATYGCTQGPRLETAAEIRRLQRDGCDVVGMTVMPEAALAREKQIAYASICPVVNWAAGIDQQPIVMDELLRVLAGCVNRIREVILKTVTTS